VSDYSGETYYVYRVEKKEDLMLVFRLQNRNLVLPKRRHQFSKWFDQFTSIRLRQSPSKLEVFLNKNTDLDGGCEKVALNNGWLSGFIDADGGFYALISKVEDKSKTSLQIRQKFFITQKTEDGDHKVLINILELFNSKANLSKILNQAKKKLRYFN